MAWVVRQMKITEPRGSDFRIVSFHILHGVRVHGKKEKSVQGEQN